MMVHKRDGYTRIIILVMLCLCTGMAGCAKEVSQSSAKKADLHFRLSAELFQQQRIGPALREVLLAIQNDPNNPEYHNMLGIIQFTRREMREAEASFLKAVRIDDRYSEAYNNLGTLYIEEGKYDKAEKALKQAISNPLYLNPEKALTNLGYVYRRMGNEEEAVSYFRKALGFNSDFYLANLHLGRIAFDKKDYKTSSQYLERGVAHCPQCTEAHFKLGFSYLQLKKLQDAHKAFEVGYNSNKESEYGQRCLDFKKILEKQQPQDKKKLDSPVRAN